jgi:uncharacterized protein YaiI (UPF0178 family)
VAAALCRLTNDINLAMTSLEAGVSVLEESDGQYTAAVLDLLASVERNRSQGGSLSFVQCS